MSKTLRRPLAITLIVLVLLAVALPVGCLLLENTRPLVLFLQDGTYADSTWPSTRKSLIRTVRKAGYSCVAVAYDNDSIGTPEHLLAATQDLILMYDPDIVLFSPLISSALDFSRYTYDQFPGADSSVPFLCGMGGSVDGHGLFDVVFSPAPGAGWDSAAQALAANDGATPLMTSLLYKTGDADGEAALTYFQQAFPENKLLVETQEDARGTRWANSILSDLAQYSVMQVATPSVDRLDTFFTEDSGLSWTVDVRYAHVVPDKALSGIVGDDLGATLAPLFAGNLPSDGSSVIRGMALSLELVRSYHPAKTGWRNLF